MTRKIVLVLSVITLSGGAMTLAGCSSKTEGERTRDAARQMENASDMITRGETAKREGAALEAKGRTTRDQGDSVEGNRLITEGQAMQKKGQADIEAGRKLKSGM